AAIVSSSEFRASHCESSRSPELKTRDPKLGEPARAAIDRQLRLPVQKRRYSDISELKGRTVVKDPQSTAAAVTAASIDAQPLEETEQQKRMDIRLISACHTHKHLLYSITSVIFQYIMKVLGFCFPHL